MTTSPGMPASCRFARPAQRGRRTPPHRDQSMFVLVIVFVALGVLGCLIVGAGGLAYLLFMRGNDGHIPQAPIAQNNPPNPNNPGGGFDTEPIPDNPTAPEKKLDLRAHLNWRKNEGIQFPGNHLGDMPMGDQTFAGVKFRVQGGAILLGGNLPGGDRPTQVQGISVNSRFKRLCAFHSTHHSTGHGIEVARYVVRYQDGTQAIFPVVYGQDVGDWWREFTPPPGRTQIGWVGANSESSIRFTVTRYDNPHPKKLANTIDFVSLGGGVNPCCAALTVER
jgi:hypothetical protein